MGSSQLPELLEWWVSAAGYFLASVSISFGLMLVLGSFLDQRNQY